MHAISDSMSPSVRHLQRKEDSSVRGGCLGFTTFDAQQIEAPKNRLFPSAQAFAVVANQYHGIDFSAR